MHVVLMCNVYSVYTNGLSVGRMYNSRKVGHELDQWHDITEPTRSVSNDSSCMDVNRMVARQSNT